MSNSIEDRLIELGFLLPPVSSPLANYVPFAVVGGLLFVSGQGPKSPEGKWHFGKVGAQVSVEQAYEYARLAGINMLAAAQSALGSLDRVKRVVKTDRIREFGSNLQRSS